MKQLGYYFMKSTLVIKSLMVFLMIASNTGAWAFQNEPDGFRGIPWGGNYWDIEKESGTFFQLSDKIANTNMLLLSSETKFAFKYVAQNILTVVTKPSDKTAIGAVKTNSPIYFFYKMRLVGVMITYFSTLDRPADVFASNYQNYSAERDVNKLLEKQFGTATKKPNLVLSMLPSSPFVDLHTNYDGETTTITNGCTGKLQNDCTLMFLSTVEWNKYKSESVTLFEKNSKLTEQNKSEQKAKPDF